MAANVHGSEPPAVAAVKAFLAALAAPPSLPVEKFRSYKPNESETKRQQRIAFYAHLGFQLDATSELSYHLQIKSKEKEIQEKTKRKKIVTIEKYELIAFLYQQVASGAETLASLRNAGTYKGVHGLLKNVSVHHIPQHGLEGSDDFQPADIVVMKNGERIVHYGNVFDVVYDCRDNGRLPLVAAGKGNLKVLVTDEILGYFERTCSHCQIKSAVMQQMSDMSNCSYQERTDSSCLLPRSPSADDCLPVGKRPSSATFEAQERCNTAGMERVFKQKSQGTKGCDESRAKVGIEASDVCDRSAPPLVRDENPSSKPVGGMNHERTRRVRRWKRNPSTSNVNANGVVAVDGWSSDQLNQLRTAHRSVDATSATFWFDVASLVHGKTEAECRSQWFSASSTPPSKHARRNAPLPIEDDNDDDIFASPSMRGSLHDFCDIDPPRALPFNLGKTPPEPIAFAPLDLPKPLKKSYLKRFNRTKAIERKGEDETSAPISQDEVAARSIVESLHDHDINIEARLTPGGTLTVHAQAEGTENEDDMSDSEY